MARDQISRIPDEELVHASFWKRWLRYPVFAALGALVACIGTVPLVASFDFGAQLVWSQYCMALMMVVLAGIAFVLMLATRYQPANMNAMGEDDGHRLPVRYTLLWTVVAICLYLGVQSYPVPSQIHSIASRGSQKVYTEWLGPVHHALDNATASENSTVFKPAISIQVQKTTHGLAVMLCLLPVIWIVTELSRSATLTRLLLSVVSTGTAVHALYGCLCQLFPSLSYSQGLEAGTGFGGFVNRNNAALLMNLGCASGLAVTCGKLSVLSRPGKGQKDFEYSDLLDLISDPGSWWTLTCVLLNAVGIVVCLSVGGILSMLFAFALTFGVRKEFRKVAFGFVVVASPLLFILFLATAENFENRSRVKSTAFSMERFVFQTLANDRVGHWKDSVRAAYHYLPAGSGAGTYGAAYLPYQEHGRELWFRHADNLWLEILVELGLPGVLAVVLLFLMTMKALRKLHRSRRSLDQAIAILGWYVLACTFASQCFDFGVFVPANAFLLAIVCAVVFARSQMVVQRSREKGSPSKLQAMPTHPTLLQIVHRSVIGAAALIVAGVSVQTLHANTKAELLSRKSEFIFDTIKKDAKQLNEWTARLDHQVAVNATEDLLKQRMRFQYQSARLKEIETRLQDDETSFDALYQATRRATRESSPQLESLRVPYLLSSDSIQRLIDLNPLSIEARAELVYLGFLQDDEHSSETLLSQLYELQRRNSPQLLRIANIAARRNLVELVEVACFQASDLDSDSAAQAVDVALSCPGVDLDKAISQKTLARRRATGHLLTLYPRYQKLSADFDHFLDLSVPLLNCTECTTRKERERCERLNGAALFKLGRTEEGLEHYSEMVRINPASTKYRIEYVRKLMECSLYEEARIQARVGRGLFNADQRFQLLIDQIAEIESKLAEDLGSSVNSTAENAGAKAE